MTQPKISSIAYLIAEPVRAVILITLADGSSMSASALADAAGVTPQTASSHLAKLLDGGLLTVETKGRNRFYQLAGPDVSHVLESLAAVSPQTSTWRSLPNRAAHELRFARCCYDHLAGQVGVAVTQGMLDRGYILDRNEREYVLTLRGIEWLQSLNPDNGEPCFQDHVQARRCLDWTEREHHIAGPLGAHLLETFCQLGWLRRTTGTRAVHVTGAGWRAFKMHLGIEHLRHLEAPLHAMAPARKRLMPAPAAG
ncbi:MULTISPECIES: helix-turn-helix transcriptional regulator [unclassified Pseudomonas]|uniref:ArsR/SmtB family transcription factor n=1 Tax=unclassified Pseudomonas TaxID=196821 RepID=UPI000C8895B8|nr:MULTISPECIES: helix-turn-helix transcriptional regulator [unclassified Pseudomonas]PMX27844.1 transcriptional regulator [Pseudomonas sp. GW460-12]PMX34576.1 transcriptional regulator [Pseudomonas sp. MPR-R2A4]PMX41238.1 transcriptional regulator [Pseudomonas sp. MPR-R2A7]PMX53751.1 transcriptional regulator [Pseudomonas sp. MPR-R2A6]PMX91675.1 transcriptional regulator [Pseudomonas sp. MPR-R2A3]